MTVLMTSDLKTRAGEILDAAKNEPQFIFRDGQIYMLSPVYPSSVPTQPDGFFADAYGEAAGERRQLRNAAAPVQNTRR
ncbi:MAG: hypothetical protein PHY43_10675 [Verrucomicrobiales bacterium]|nr:hypothetical protein [Verrucomicrobiales bacterium]